MLITSHSKTGNTAYKYSNILKQLLKLFLLTQGFFCWFLKLPWKNWKSCVIFVFLISEWHDVIVVALLPIALSNANVNMFRWLFCGGDNAFVYRFFNPTISIHWKIIFASASTWCYGSFACIGHSFVMLFSHSAYIFHSTIAHFNCIFIKNFLLNLLDFGKSLLNKRKNIFATRSWWHFC